jgi:phosphoglycolate phosphatase
VRLAVFDCDGTLVDTQHAILAAMTAAWRAHGRSAPAPEAVRRIVGLPLVTAIAALLPDGDAEDHVVLAQHYKRAFKALRQSPGFHEPLFPGAVDALDALEAADVVLGVATGKSRPGLVATLDRHGLVGRFVTLQTGDEGSGKPSPDMLLRAMAETGAAAQDTVMVGDTVFDMKMAQNAGVTSVGVGWGYHDTEELWAAGAAAVVTAFEEIPATVDRLTRSVTCA